MTVLYITHQASQGEGGSQALTFAALTKHRTVRKITVLSSESAWLAVTRRIAFFGWETGIPVGLTRKNKSTLPAESGDFPNVAPVQIPEFPDNTISHSLAILSTVYRYNHWIFDSIRDYLGRNVAEIGSGVGNISQFLLNAEKLVCIEPFALYQAYLTQRFSRHLNVSVFGIPLERCPNPDIPAGTFDSVVCLNVLEHIEDDAGARVNMRKLLAVGGRVVVLVPAVPWAFGAMDTAMGHYRRYSRKSLLALFKDAGLVVEKATYMNVPGLLGWWWHGRILKRERLSSGATRAFDKIVPFVSALERLFPIPLGQSLVVIGRLEAG